MMHSLSRPQGLLSFVMVLMIAGLMILLNTFLTMLIASRVGAYVALAAAGGISLITIGVYWSSLSRYLFRIRKNAKSGIVPHMAYRQLAGLLIGIIFAIIPGPLTVAVAWFMYIPPIRLGVGAVLYRWFGAEFQTLHEDIQAE